MQRNTTSEDSAAWVKEKDRKWWEEWKRECKKNISLSDILAGDPLCEAFARGALASSLQVASMSEQVKHITDTKNGHKYIKGIINDDDLAIVIFPLLPQARLFTLAEFEQFCADYQVEHKSYILLNKCDVVLSDDLRGAFSLLPDAYKFVDTVTADDYVIREYAEICQGRSQCKWIERNNHQVAMIIRPTSNQIDVMTMAEIEKMRRRIARQQRNQDAL